MKLTKPKLETTTNFNCVFKSTSKSDNSVATTNIKIEVFEPPKPTKSVCSLKSFTHSQDMSFSWAYDAVLFDKSGNKVKAITECPGDELELVCETPLKQNVELKGVKLMLKQSLTELKGSCELIKTHTSNAGTTWETKTVEKATAQISFIKVEKVFKAPPKLDIPLREFINYVPQDNMVMYQGSMTEPSCEENVTWLINLNANVITAE